MARVTVRTTGSPSGIAATATPADERRHVQFGISHVRRRLAIAPDVRDALIGAAEAREEAEGRLKAMRNED